MLPPLFPYRIGRPTVIGSSIPVLMPQHHLSEVFDGDGKQDRIAYPEETQSSYAEEFEAFADYVAGVAEGPTTGVSERRSLAVVQAGYESAESGQAVNLTERFGDL